MPNHCLNTLVVADNSDTYEFAAFMAGIHTNVPEGEEFAVLNSFVPMPEFAGSDDWYTWCIDNWGTKWGEYDTRVLDVFENGMFATFTTAWDPPIVGYLKVSEKFPGLRFALSYREDGMQRIGTVIMQNGEIIGEAIAPSDEWPDWDPDTENYDEYDEAVIDLCDRTALRALATVSIDGN